MAKKPTYEELEERVKDLEKQAHERRQAKEELKRERNMFLKGPVVIFRWAATENWPAEYVSPNVTQFGYQADDFLSGKIHYIDIIYPEDVERIVSEVRDYSESGVAFYEQEYRIIQADGEVRWVYDFTIIHRNDQNEITHYDGYILDTTRRKQAEEALQESEERYRLLLESITDGVQVTDREMRYVLVNDELARMTQMPKERLLGNKMTDLFPGVEETVFFKTFKQVMETGEPATAADEFTFPDRRKAWYEVHVYPVQEGLFVIVTDTTEHRRTEEALKESEARYRALFEGAAEGIIVADIETKDLIYANPAICRMLGYSEEELRQMGVSDIHLKEDLEHVISEFEAQARKEKTLAQDIPCLRKDGEIIYADITTSKAFIDGREYNVGLFTETTERKKAEEEKRKLQAQILQSEKMAAIGQLAAGVAHEINNPTGFVSSNLKTLSDYQSDILSLIEEYRKLAAHLKEAMAKAQFPGPIPEQMERIVTLESEVDIDYILDDSPNLIKESQEGTERIKRIVIDLKDFAHPGEDKVQTIDINKGIESTLNIVWNELKYKAEVKKEYGHLPLVKGYPHQLNQVFMNLLVNAAQAIEKRGEIRIATRAVDGYVEIEISDTGVGIPKQDLLKIFDPFFTTKGVGKGTGLGLSMAYNIIQKHKGTIDVESEVGKGTTFIIRLETDPDLVE